MGSGGDENLASERSTVTIRAYRGDQSLLRRIIRHESAERNEDVTVAMIIHEALEPYRAADAARGGGQ